MLTLAARSSHGWNWLVYGAYPVLVPGPLSTRDTEVQLPQPLHDGADLAGAHGTVVDLSNRRYLNARAALWEQGDVVRDRFGWVMNPGVAEGRHPLWVRLWDPSAQRLLWPSGSGEDRVRLGKVYVAR